MNNFGVYYPLGELDSFVDQLPKDYFYEFCFDSLMRRDGDYVLFSFIKEDGSEKVTKMVKIVDEIPLPYITNPYMDKAIFTVLCFVLKHKLTEVEIYGQCNIIVVGGDRHNHVVVSKVSTSDAESTYAFLPDLNSLNEVFKSIEDAAFNDIKVDMPLIIYKTPTVTNYKWTLVALLKRFNFINMKQS